MPTAICEQPAGSRAEFRRVVHRSPPGRQCVETCDDERALVGFAETIAQSQAIERAAVRCRAAKELETERIVDQVIAALLKPLA
jgi:hypothetical protein